MYGLYGLIFFNPKIVRIVRICFQIVRILSWKIHRFFLIFTHFSKFFMKIKKNSRQNEVSLTYFLHSK